jgi:RNA-directed DNA polymerase
LDTRTFEQAFNAVFHDNKAFIEFCSLNVESEFEKISINSRSIYKTSPKLKKYLRFIDKVILRHLQKNENVVHSYIKERSSLTAIQPHVKSKYFFTTDINDFFINIKTKDVENILKRDKDLIPISDFENFIPTITKLITWSDSIPVGFVTSPKLSNAFLLEFDSALNNLCLEKELIYTRYSDDIIISAQSYDEFNILETEIQRLLWKYASENITLNKKKTRKTHIGGKVKLLGLIITPAGRVTIDSKYKKTLESLLHFYINDKSKFQNLLDKEMGGKEHSLFGLLHYMKSIDPDYLEKLKRKYGIYALSTLMEDKWND